MNTGNSSVYIAEGRFLPTKVLMKQVHSNDAASQYRSLVAIDGILGNASNRVPHPLACIEEHNLICMEYVDGSDLRKYLANFRIASGEKRLAIARAGHWLARFHLIERRDPVPVDVANKLADLNACIKNSAEQLDRDPVLATAHDWLVSQSNELRHAGALNGIVHGDFKSENLIVTNGGMVGIDFHHDAIGTQIMDLAQFANNLRLLGLQPGGLQFRKHAAYWIDQFIAAYETESGQISQLLFKWIRVHHMLRYWGIERGRKTPLGILQAMWIRKEVGLLMELD